MLKDWVYVRVSTVEQIKGLSLETQEAACREYSARNDGNVVRVFREQGASAKTMDRPELRTMLEEARRNPGALDRIIVFRWDRLARSSEDHHALRGLLAAYGIPVRSATEATDDSPAGRAMEGMIAVFSQFDNDSRRHLVRTGMAEASRRGRWVFGAPIGYRRSRDRSGPSLVPDAEQADFVRLAFELFDTGQHSQTDVLCAVTAAGLRNPSTGKPLTKQTLATILRRRTYTGWFDVPKFDVFNARADFEPLVSEELFERVEHVLSGRRPSVPERRKAHPDFPLRRFVRCARCDRPMTGFWAKGKRKRYAYYRCQTRHCETKQIPKARLESEFLDFLDRLSPIGRYRRLFREIVLKAWQTRHSDVRKLREQLQARVDELRARKDRLVNALVEGALDNDTYREHAARADQDLALARVELQEATVDEIDVEAVLVFAENSLSDLTRLWKSLPAPKQDRLQWAIFPEGLAHDGSKYQTPVTNGAFTFLRVLGSNDPEWCPRGDSNTRQTV